MPSSADPSGDELEGPWGRDIENALDEERGDCESGVDAKVLAHARARHIAHA